MNVNISPDDFLTDEFEQALSRSLEKVLQKLQQQLGSAQPDKLLLGADEAAKQLSICAKSLWSLADDPAHDEEDAPMPNEKAFAEKEKSLGEHNESAK